MSSQQLPPDIAEAIRRLDAAAADWPEELIADWKKIRGFCRSKNNHAQAALEAMSGVFGQYEEPDTAKHGKLPPDDQR